VEREGFTLIELLVVIAIIAVLAALLFPVFTQAKRAAKAAASISNIKQIGISALLYASGSDDRVFPVVSYGQGYPGMTRAGMPFANWGWLSQPYLKSAEIFDDPQIMGRQPSNLIPKNVMQAYRPMYGYNYTLWSPSTVTWSDPVDRYIGQSQDSIDRPSEMVMFATRSATQETSGNSWWVGPRSLSTNDGGIEPVDCGSIIVSCMTSWGTNSFYSGSNYSLNNYEAGAQTGFVSLRKMGNAIVLWGDTHATAPAPGKLAEGTNWIMGMDTADVQTLDKSRSHWNNENQFF